MRGADAATPPPPPGCDAPGCDAEASGICAHGGLGGLDSDVCLSMWPSVVPRLLVVTFSDMRTWSYFYRVETEERTHIFIIIF